MNKNIDDVTKSADGRYSVKVEIPISIILETIFSDDNYDVEILARWAKKYGFIDLIDNYYTLQDDYNKQSFFAILGKEERKQYDYETYLLDKIDVLEDKLMCYKERYGNIEDAAQTEIEDSQYIHCLMQGGRLNGKTYVSRLQQENQQLKDNWNKLKEYISIKLYNTEYLQKLCGCGIDDFDHMLLDVIREEMQKLEEGTDSNE